ncbi:MAG TPA: hypothetical protein VMU03_09815, partial [Gammaproteobacteria bacterium]|nr:hypothetical protein [Gammaproteobacteria bacterium]
DRLHSFVSQLPNMRGPAGIVGASAPVFVASGYAQGQVPFVVGPGIGPGIPPAVINSSRGVQYAPTTPPPTRPASERR